MSGLTVWLFGIMVGWTPQVDPSHPSSPSPPTSPTLQKHHPARQAVTAGAGAAGTSTAGGGAKIKKQGGRHSTKRGREEDG